MLERFRRRQAVQFGPGHLRDREDAWHPPQDQANAAGRAGLHAGRALRDV